MSRRKIFLALRFCLLMVAVFLLPAHTVLADANSTDDIQAIYGDQSFFSLGGGGCAPTGGSAPPSSGTGNGTIDLSYKDTTRNNRDIGATAWLPNDTSKPHPLVMFAPGRDVDSKADGLYKRYLATIAQQGYVVVGANFSDNHSADAVPADSEDMKFLLTQALTEQKLQGKIDTSAGVGLIGHSDGGMIALTVGYGAKKDDRVTAVIAEDGAVGVGAVGAPLLLMHGAQDDGNTSSIQGAYDASKAPYTAFALFNGADHYHYITGAARGDNVTDYDNFHPSVDAVTGAFLKRMLNKDGTDASSLNKVVAAQPKDMITFSEKGNDTVTGGATNNPTSATPVTSCSCPSNGSAPLTGDDNTAKAFNFFVQQGFSAAQAAGIVGNFEAESGEHLDTKADNGSHHGIAQWDTGPNGRYDHLKAFAGAKTPPLDPESIDAQLQFVIEELNGGWKAAADDLKKQTNPTAAAESWLNLYEGAPGQQLEKRQEYARTALTDFGNTITTSSNTSASVSCVTSSSGEIVGGFSLPLDKKWYDEHKDWFTKPHHGYPAADIPVPDGTPVYSMTAGKVLLAPNEGGYGEGVTIQLSNGTLFNYGHGNDGGTIDGAKQGDTVTAGQLIMHSNHTGHVIPAGPGGAHLHVDILIKGGGNHCPQNLFVAIAENQPIPDLSSLPTTGCFN
jgi:murein DD-endopeptidase MepM/ murein hydrolase activator NlpD